MKNVINLVVEYIDKAENPCWEDFHKKHPDVDFFEWEMGVKSYQEM